MTFNEIIINLKNSINNILNKINYFKKILPGITDNVELFNKIIFPILDIIKPILPLNISIAISLIREFDIKILDYLNAIEETENVNDIKGVNKLSNAAILLLPETNKNEIKSASSFVFRSVEQASILKNDPVVKEVLNINYIVNFINKILNKNK